MQIAALGAHSPFPVLSTYGLTIRDLKYPLRLTNSHSLAHFDQPISSPSLPATHGYGFIDTTLGLDIVEAIRGRPLWLKR